VELYFKKAESFSNKRKKFCLPIPYLLVVISGERNPENLVSRAPNLGKLYVAF